MRVSAILISVLLLCGVAAPVAAQSGSSRGRSSRPNIQLFSSTGFQGTRVRLTTSTSSLGFYNFNNRARSARVVGRWTVCDRPNFRGRCRTISSSRSSLASMGMSGTISSVRLIGR
jgi:hypothetical protein